MLTLNVIRPDQQICRCKELGLAKYVGSYICDHYNLKVKFPELAAEWDYERNPNNPKSYAPNSGKKVWWICPKKTCDCHRYEATIANRAKKRGCPYCINKKLCIHNNLFATYPDLCKEWDYGRNIKGPESYAPGSNIKVWWKCLAATCDCHRYNASINMRTSQNTQCPYCSNKILCSHNNLTITHPELSKEWCYERNPKGPENYSYGSNCNVWWICPINKCGCHIYETDIASRTGRNIGCPYCIRRSLCPHNNLIATHPKLLEEWDYERNSKGPENYSYGMNAMVW